jgi:hypothetical protein
MCPDFQIKSKRPHGGGVVVQSTPPFKSWMPRFECCKEEKERLDGAGVGLQNSDREKLHELGKCWYSRG